MFGLKSSRVAFAAACYSALGVSLACAHVTLEKKDAPVGGFYKAVFRVPHGCAGSSTIRLRVRIPDGFIGVKPMPKPGWTLDTMQADYAKTYALEHGQVSRGVKEVSWGGGRLPDDRYDEFTLIGFVAADLKPGTTLYFPTVQDCESGAERWIDLPGEGQSARDLKSPAPGLTLTAGPSR